jgi:hypothetical protein
MKKFLGIIALMFLTLVAFSQDYSYTLKKTLSPSVTSTDYAFWNFPVATFSSILMHRGDTTDLSIAVDISKDVPTIPSLEFKFTNKSGSTDSLYISGTVKGSQFHLMTSEPTTGLTLTTISSTKINMSSTDPYYYIISDSINSVGLVVPKTVTGVKHLRSVLYTLRFIPRGLTDTIKISGIRFKTWVNPAF